METDDRTGGYFVRKYDIHLLEQLNEEYRSKPLQSTFPQYDPESQFKIAEERLRRLSELVGLKEKKVLEVGCGRGYLSKSLADWYGCSVLAIDIREDVEWQTLRNPPNLDYLVLDLSETNPFAEGSFDLIVSFVAWEHMMHPFTMLRECCKTLKPQGKIYIHANVYRSPRASHLYRDIYFPFPHLLFPEEVIAEFCLKHGVSKHLFDEYIYRNKLTYGQYKEYFELLNLGIEYEQLHKTKLDMDFYERFKDKLERYPRSDLELDFFEVVLVKDYGGLPKSDYLEGALTRERDARRKEAGQFNVELNTTKVGLNSTKAELKNSKTELNNTKAELSNTKAELKNSKTELNNTKAELTNTKTELNNAKAELNNTKAEVNNSKAELNNTRAELNNIKADLGATKAERDTARASLAKETTRLQAELVTTKAELDTARAGLAKETTRLQAELVTTKAELNNIKADLGATKAELTTTKVELETTQAGLSTTKAELNATKAELRTTGAKLVKETTCLQAELNTAKARRTKEITRLSAELAKAKGATQAVRDSVSFRLGHALVRPIRRPGRTAVLLSYRLLKMSPRGLKRVIVGVTRKSKLLTSLRSLADTAARSSAKQEQRDAVLQRSETAGLSTNNNKAGVQETETATRSSTQQEQRRVVSPKSKTADFSTSKAAVLEVVKGRINKIKREMGSGTMVAREPRRKDLKIAVIMDRFTYDCFKYEANLITFTPENWKQVLSADKPDFLLVESAWRGNDESWRYQIVNLREKPASRLPELVQWCKARNVPTAFWNKEDPPHYDDFLDAARLFDYVFTSDAGCIKEYKKDLGHSNIFCLPFAAQPRIHNPIGSGQKIRDVAFAGTWHATETEDKKQRREQMADVLAPVLPYGVDIYDRNFGSKDARYRFPERYQPSIVGQLPYDEMVYAYKIYKIFLNVNSVMDSPTMFPRRVLEILASGTCVLSGYCKGIENMLGTHTVPMSSSPEETELLLKKLLENKEVRDRLAHAGLRKVMKEHTCEKRVGYILKTMGLRENEGGDKGRGVSVITSTNKLGYMDSIFANYNRQDYEDKELIIVLNNNQLNLEEWGEKAKSYPNVTVCQLDQEEGLGTCLNFGVDRARFEYIAKFDDDDYYSPLYLEDLMMAFDYSGADIVGKSTYYVYLEKDTALAIRFPGREHCFREFVSGPTMLMKRGVFEKIRFDSKKGRGSDTRFQRECVRNGFRIYSADRFNFAVLRRTSKDMHTWKMTDEEVMEASEIIAFGEDYVSHITV